MDEGYIAGINKMKKPATKVMAPPGGKTNINLFGGDQPAPRTPVNEGQKKRNQSSVFAGPETTDNNMNSTKPPPAVVADGDVPPPVDGAVAPGGGRASTKVMAPPGGKTSINLFGWNFLQGMRCLVVF